jgi:hypothetical protein
MTSTEAPKFTLRFHTRRNHEILGLLADRYEHRRRDARPRTAPPEGGSSPIPPSGPTGNCSTRSATSPT